MILPAEPVDTTREMPRRAPANSEYSHLFRLLHWTASITLVILFLTGLSLHAAARPDWSVFSGAVPTWLWRGRVYVWHFWSAVVFVPSLLAILTLSWRTRFWLRPAQSLLVLGSLATSITGVWLLLPIGSFTTIKVVVGLHAATGIVILPLVFLWHGIRGVVLTFRLLVESFRPFRNPRWSQVAWFLPIPLVTTMALLEGWPFAPPWRELTAQKVNVEVGQASDLSELPWNPASALTIRLVNGSGFYSGQTDLTLEALHNGDELFLKAQWQDPVADSAYWPWLRTKSGWEYQQTSSKDETVHYEDKFSILFPTERSWHFEQVGCATHCHVDAEYGWGYKGGLPILDVWHWKSVRTDPVGQVDDKYWAEVDLELKDVGRHGDPSTGGGYTKNLVEDGSRPAFLARDALRTLRGNLTKETAVAYTTERADSLPAGTLVPGVTTEAFQGDRGDVSCQASHEADHWTLYIRRKLETGSRYDVKFSPGESFPFGCAAFDHAAKRHAYSVPVYYLSLEGS